MSLDDEEFARLEVRAVRWIVVFYGALLAVALVGSLLFGLLS